MPSFSLEHLLTGQFILFTLVLTRVSGLMLTVPVFGATTAPYQVRGLLTVAMSMILWTAQIGTPVPPPGNTLNYAVYLGGELLVGLAMGLGVHILFSGVQVAGQIIGQLSGLALADVFNPTFDANSPVFSQILFHVALAVFVLIGGHHVVIAGLLDTFSFVPPGTALIGRSVLDSLVGSLTGSFIVGIRSAAPVMVALFLATFILGLISRTLPQMNILAIGFGLNAMITMSALMFSFSGAVWVFQDQVTPVVEDLGQALFDDQQRNQVTSDDGDASD
jgi:flagellar biosynthesis protein FliR